MKKFRLDGVVGKDFTASYVAQMIDGESDIEVTLNTSGGYIEEGMAIYNAIIDFNGKSTVIIDKAMSMGSIIMLAFDKRIARKNSSIIMIHRPHGGGMGRSEDMRSAADTLDKYQAQMTGIYLEKMGISESILTKMLDDETYMDADEAFALGLVDEVISGSRSALHQIAFAALADNLEIFDRIKFAAKVRQIEAKSSDFCATLQKAAKLSDIEASLRTRGLSRAEATAIVSSVKRVHGDHVDKAAEDSAAKALKLLNNFKL